MARACARPVHQDPCCALAATIYDDNPLKASKSWRPDLMADCVPHAFLNDVLTRARFNQDEWRPIKRLVFVGRQFVQTNETQAVA